MAEYMHLVGTEQIQSAANRMVEAANIMNKAANTMSEALHRHEIVMQELIDELRDNRKG